MTLVIDPTAPPESDAPVPAGPPDAPPRLAIVLGNIGRGLILAGIVVLLFVVFQLWGTDLQESRAQGDLRGDLETRFDEVTTQFSELPIAAPAPADAGSDEEPAVADPDDDPVIAAGTDTDVALAEPDPNEVDEALLALLFPDEGDALAKIEIPSLDVDKVVVRGVAVADLRRGPGHYSQTALPGNPGNAGIAGHRTTYGSPFNRIDELVPGDEIVVTTVQGEFVYRVVDPDEAYADAPGTIDEVGGGHIIVHPTATWVLDDFGDDRLTLTACHPKLSSRQRIIVAAELVEAPVVVPDWAIQAQAEREALADDAGGAEGADPTGLGADGTGDTIDSSQTVSSSASTTETADGPDLDEGLNGDRDAIMPGLIWLVAAILLWYAGGRLGRRFAEGRAGVIGYRLAGFAPAMVCLWFSFELIDRALPAG